MLNRGESPLKGEEPGLEELLAKVAGAGKFSSTADVRCGGPRDPDAVFGREGSPPGLHAAHRGAPERRAVPHTWSARRPWINDHPRHDRGRMAREILEAELRLVAGEDFVLAHAPGR